MLCNVIKIKYSIKEQWIFINWYYRVEEHWKPQMEGLEEIVANRQIPALHIFMSLEPIDDNVKG